MTSEQNIADSLARVEEDCARVKPAAAQAALKNLIGDLSPDDLSRWQSDIRATIGVFEQYLYKKRAIALRQYLGSCIEGSPHDPPLIAVANVELNELLPPFEDALQYLSNNRIWVWPEYRDQFNDFFQQFTMAFLAHPTTDCGPLRNALRSHSQEIFQKGLDYHAHIWPLDAVLSKSMQRLCDLLDIPVEEFAYRVYQGQHPQIQVAARHICSAMISGILLGYTDLRDDLHSMKDHLDSNADKWVRFVPFLTAGDIRALVAALQPRVSAERIEATQLCFSEAIDDLSQSGDQYVPLPVLSEFVDVQGSVLDITMSEVPSATERLVVTCFFDPNVVSLARLDDAMRRNSSLIIAHPRSDLRERISASQGLKDRIVWPSIASGDRITATRIKSVLGDAQHRLTSQLQGNEPIAINFASQFPLNKPRLDPHYHVDRSSVSTLLRSFDRKSGVRLWCSVRRSGKTTACYDLGSRLGESHVVLQTCAGTSPDPSAHVFYSQIKTALASPDQIIPAHFFADAVRGCREIFPSAISTSPVRSVDGGVAGHGPPIRILR